MWPLSDHTRKTWTRTRILKNTTLEPRKGQMGTFKRLCHLNQKACLNQEDHNIYLTKTLLTIAEECTPKSSTQPKFNKPWYNNECKKAVRARRAALRKFKTNPTKKNLEFFKNCSARTRRSIKEAKQETWKKLHIQNKHQHKNQNSVEYD